MVVYFDNLELKDLYAVPLGKIRGKQKYPLTVIKKYKKRVQLLVSVRNLESLRQFRGLNFEHLKGNRKGQCSIRLNDQYRLIITPEKDDAITIVIINEISKHYE